jgi:hypothetical protein
VSKAIGINRNVAWKLSRLIHATDPYEMHPHLPGNAGMHIVLRAFERHGAPADELRAVTGAWSEFEAMVERHAGNRRRLALLLASRSAQEGSGDEGLAARRAAFEGLSAVFGAQARVRLGLSMMAPSREASDRAAIVSISGLLDFRRLRETTCWPMVQVQGFDTEGEPGPGRRQPLEPNDGDPERAPLLTEFSTSPPPELVVTGREDVRTYELRPGPVGRAAAVDVVFGTILPAAVPIYDTDDDPNSVGEHYCRIDTPVERLLFDLYVHRDLPFELPPSMALYSLLHGRLDYPLSQQEASLLPVPGRIQELGSPPVVSTPAYGDHGRLVARAAAALGVPLGELRGYRYELAYPPVPSVAVMHHPLPPSPRG